MQAYAKQIVKMQRPPVVRAQALEMVLLVGWNVEHEGEVNELR